MDLSKCFDIMWKNETMNDLYDLGVVDDKFVLVSKLNEDCKVTVKTPVGVTEEFQLENIEMQGTVPAPLKCAGQMDGLGRKCYMNEDYLYHYNGSCYVPSLGFIDDTFAATRCGEQSVMMNALINTFIESKKLYFNTNKCYLIHVGPRKEECCQLKVHDRNMKQTTSEKYLGDVVSSSGNGENIENREKIGRTCISDILSMLKVVGIGGHYMRVALVLRDSMLKSKLLLNSGIWHGLTNVQVNRLENIDKSYLRTVLKSHSKVAIECLFFETGKKPLKYEIMRNRLMYWWKILHVEENELIFRVYQSQKNSPNSGDWIKLLSEDKSALCITMDDEDLKKTIKE